MQNSEDFKDAIGCPCPIKRLTEKAEWLSAKVEEKVNGSQELVIVNDLAKDLNESLIKKCLQDRITDIASWRWVFEDLSHRLEDSIRALEYEMKALRVIVQRIKDEIYDQTKKTVRPGLIVCPAIDEVETSIRKELDFLRLQKKTFESFIPETQMQIQRLEKTKARIKRDIFNKIETLALEESCVSFDLNNLSPKSISTKTKHKKRRTSTLSNWENRCMALKRDGLKALCNGLVMKQKIRGARVQLTLESQATANKVDSALRKRLHANKIKVQELEWQQEEIGRDLKSLEEEQLNTEQSLVANMEQERAVEARLKDRSHRPPGELTRDEVDFNLKGELARVRSFIKELRNNLYEIQTLQDNLKDTLTKTYCVTEDIYEVLDIDEQRAALRFGGYQQVCKERGSSSSSSGSQKNTAVLRTIAEEEEDDDKYPFDDE